MLVWRLNWPLPLFQRRRVQKLDPISARHRDTIAIWAEYESEGPDANESEDLLTGCCVPELHLLTLRQRAQVVFGLR